MSYEPIEWDEKVNITWREYFNPPWHLPHIGIVRLARRMEEELGKERAHEIIREEATKLSVEWMKKYTSHVEINSLKDIPKALKELHREPLITVSPKKNGDPCLMAETYKAMGARDIGYLWVCASEKPEFECLHPSIRRTVGETLMTGHHLCERETWWEEEKDA